MAKWLEVAKKEMQMLHLESVTGDSKQFYALLSKMNLHFNFGVVHTAGLFPLELFLTLPSKSNCSEIKCTGDGLKHLMKYKYIAG